MNAREVNLEDIIVPIHFLLELICVAVVQMMFSKSDSKITVSTKPKQAEPAGMDGLTFDDIPDIGDVLSKGPSGKSSKKLSVERIYQKKSQLEHILLRPDTYIGSVEHTTQVEIISIATCLNEQR